MWLQVPDSMDQQGVTMSTDARVQQAVERRRARASGGVDLPASTPAERGSAPPASAADQGISRLSRRSSYGGSSAGSEVHEVDEEPPEGASEEQLLEQLPGAFERMKTDEARRRRVAIEARGAAGPPAQKRARSAPAVAVAQRQALAQERLDAQKQFQQKPAATSARSDAADRGPGVGSAQWFARRAASMASLHALVAPASAAASAQPRAGRHASVSIGRRRNKTRVIDVLDKVAGWSIADAEPPATMADPPAPLDDSVTDVSWQAAQRLGVGQGGGVRALYESRREERDLQRTRESQASRGEDEDGEWADGGNFTGSQSFASQKHWRPTLEARQRQRKAKQLLSELQEVWSVDGMKERGDGTYAISQFRSAVATSLVPPPASTLPWPTVSLSSQATTIPAGKVPKKTKIPKVPKKSPQAMAAAAAAQKLEQAIANTKAELASLPKPAVDQVSHQLLILAQSSLNPHPILTESCHSWRKARSAQHVSRSLPRTSASLPARSASGGRMRPPRRASFSTCRRSRTAYQTDWRVTVSVHKQSAVACSVRYCLTDGL